MNISPKKQHPDDRNIGSSINIDGHDDSSHYSHHNSRHDQQKESTIPSSISRSTFCDLCADATPRISPKHVERASTS